MSDIEQDDFERWALRHFAVSCLSVIPDVHSRYRTEYQSAWETWQYLSARSESLQVMINELTEAMARMGATTSQADEHCEWKQDHSDGLWEAACGYSLMLDGQGPEENGIKYCPECGKPCVVVEPTEGQDDE